MSKERYISMSNGKLVIVTKNDGYSLAARDPEREEKEVALEDLKGTRFYDEAKSLLQRLNGLSIRLRAAKAPSTDSAQGEAVFALYVLRSCRREGGEMASVVVSFVDGHLPTEQIVLPRESDLGIFEGLDDQPTGVWPLTLLCFQHGHVFERSADSVQYGPVTGPGRRTQTTPIWTIDCVCAQGNCGRKIKVFAFGDEPQTDVRIRLRLLRTEPALPCLGHTFVLDAGAMTVERLEGTDY